MDEAPPEAHIARSVSSRFRRLLADEGWNQKQGSDQLDMSQHTVHDLYHGNSWPSFAVIARIEHRLRATVLHGAYELTDAPAEVYQQPPIVPNSYLAEGERWPHGDLVDGAPAEARLAQAIAKNVFRALKSREWIHETPQGWSYDRASEKLKLPTHTLRDVCEGERWVSFAVIARMDDHFDFPLWASSRRMAAESE